MMQKTPVLCENCVKIIKNNVMKLTKRWVSFLLAGCGLCLMGCMPEAKPHKVLKIGYTHYQPMNYMDEKQGKLVGFDAEFARQVCDELGYTAEFVEIIWGNKVRDLKAGTIDCIWNGMTITEELSAEILVSDPYLANRQVAVVPLSFSQNPVSLLDFSMVAFEDGGVAESLLIKGNLPHSSMREAATQRAALAEVVAGNADAAIIDYTMAKNMVGKDVYAELSFVEIEGVETEYYGIGFRKEDTELCGKVNQLIEKYKQDGTFESLENKYL